jgi:hypothetical protein
VNDIAQWQYDILAGVVRAETHWAVSGLVRNIRTHTGLHDILSNDIYNAGEPRDDFEKETENTIIKAADMLGLEDLLLSRSRDEIITAPQGVPLEVMLVHGSTAVIAGAMAVQHDKYRSNGIVIRPGTDSGPRQALGGLSYEKMKAIFPSVPNGCGIILIRYKNGTLGYYARVMGETDRQKSDRIGEPPHDISNYQLSMLQAEQAAIRQRAA